MVSVFKTSFALWFVLVGGVFAVELRIKGSDTINGALTPALARVFQQKNPGVEVTVEALGSSTAFVGLLDGSAHIGTSSRPVTPKERADFASRGLTLREFVFGFDGVAVIVHPSNPVESLTVGQVAALFSGQIQNWAEVGGEAQPVRRISRPSYSGTHAFFKEKVLKAASPKGNGEFARDTEFLEDNYEILNQVASDPKAVAYVGMGWLEPRVKALAVAASQNQPAFPPQPIFVRSGQYPLYRPLYAYTLAEPTPLAVQFLQFALSQEGQKIVADHGFVPLETAVPVAAGETQPHPGAAENLRLFRIYFAFGSAELPPGSREILHDVAAQLQQGRYKAIIVGHSDSKGSSAASRAMAEARARNVAAYLKRLGVPPELLIVSHRGAEEPLASNETPAGRAKNRRVDLTLAPR
ncbi:MAG: phosphate ABC transporter substrate-binding/OmpA family protein [Thermoanaerobaculum sp.]|nr:phosphate ABC transporter substrate-binding/OmpA family protein [Thermoanaerobaculum sp.]